MRVPAPHLLEDGSFVTARLIAEPLSDSHLPDLIRMHADPLHMATLGGVKDEDETRDYLERNLACWERDGFGLWMLRWREAGPESPIIGRGLLRTLQRVEGNEVEVGYSFEPAWWGRGLATEISRACVAIGFDHFGLMSIVALTQPTNHASRHVLEKSGLVYERDVMHANLPHVLYRTTEAVREGASA